MNTRKGTFRHVASTEKAYQMGPLTWAPGTGFWIPRSVCTHRSKLDDDLYALTELTVEAWWLVKNPEFSKYFS